MATTVNPADLDPLGEWPIDVRHPSTGTNMTQQATHDKADANVGWAVHKMLVAIGLETPFDAYAATARRQDPAHMMRLQEIFGEFMSEMGLDLADDSLADTPKRMAKMFSRELFSGLDYNAFPKATVVENKMKCDEMVLVRNIRLQSVCEHHLLPIHGVAHIAYIPNDKVLGLSKFSRIVDFFARRPQIQERLTSQIHATLKFLLNSEHVAIVIEAEHLCMQARGVEDPCSDTVTSKLSGDFRKPEVRAEFMALRHKPTP